MAQTILVSKDRCPVTACSEYIFCPFFAPNYFGNCYFQNNAIKIVMLLRLT